VKPESLHETVQQVLKEAPFAMRQLAAESQLSYDVLRSWRSGRRRANPDSARRLAAGLAARADKLQNLARELRRMSERP
jgi:hypothetical protein